MRSSTLVKDVPTEVNPVHLAMLRQAIDESGVKHSYVAACLGVSPSYLSDALRGEKPAQWAWMDLLPEEVDRVFARIKAERLGLQVSSPSDLGRVIAEAIVEYVAHQEADAHGLPPRTRGQVKAATR